MQQPEDGVHDYRRVDRGIDETIIEARLLRKRLELVTGSPGWKLICWYRRLLRGTVWSRPLLKRCYELVAQGVLQRVFGSQPDKGSAESASPAWPPGPINESVLQQVLEGDQIILVFDEASPGSRLEVRGKTEFFGWAAARSGILDIQATLGGTEPLQVKTGLFRPDIEMLLPEYEASGRSGFRVRLNGADYTEGLHDLRIEAQAPDGESTVLSRRLLCDSREPYQVWISENESPETAPDLASSKAQVSVALPLNSEPVTSVRAGIDSVIEQSVADWQLVIELGSDCTAELRELAQSFASQDDRIQIAQASQLLDRCTGDYVVCLEPGCLLPPSALAELALAVERDESIDVLYSDEDSIDPKGRRCKPIFKPGYSPDLIRSCNYIGGLLAARRSTIEAAGGLVPDFDLARNYDLFLRLTERTSKIVRIPKVLCHRTDANPGVLAEVSAQNKRALEEHLDRTGENASVEEIEVGTYRVRYALAESPAVAVIIPTAGNIARLTDSLDAIFQATYHGPLRILVADNSKGAAIESLIAGFSSGGRVERLDYRDRPFNFSGICNAVARTEQAPLYLFLNDDVEALNPDWLIPMVEHAMRPPVGVVGARLRFPDLTIQHSGVIMGIHGMLGTPFYRQRGGNDCGIDLSSVTRNCAAVTGACLLTRRDVFWELGGFDEVRLQISYQDIDYCLRAQEAGYRVVYTPHAELLHHESVSRVRAGLLGHPNEHGYMRERWARWIEDDPYYNPNLSRDKENLEVRFGSA